ncbi:MFS general substrate transporter [Biscogniauxia mediterranea]|nr:MFS general substrate transporter [Biscogniauxia mediterranea]
MQSILQYRRLREAARDDVTRCRRPKSRGSPTGSTTPEYFSNGEKDAEARDPPMIGGVQVLQHGGNSGAVTYLVGWKEADALDPHNWSLVKKWWCTVAVGLLGIAISIPSSIDGPVATALNEHYHVSPIAGSLTTGLYLIGLGVGSLFAGPFSETFGRNMVYIVSMVVFMLFLLAKGLAPNFGAALAFRFLAGLFASTPLTCAGGTVADVWSTLESTFAMPFYTMFSYAGPILGPVIGAYLPGMGFRWADWMSLIISAAIFVAIVLFQPETYSPLLLEWRAHHLRELTGDSRYLVEHASTHSLGRRLLINIYRPFQMTYTEPIILVFSFYLIILYVVLFTFLNGYPYIFTRVYGISESLTYILWVAILVGDAVAMLFIPTVYGWTKKAAAKAEATGRSLQPETSLYWAMMGGSILMPVSLFWMGWTCYSHISIWSPIVGSFVFGYCLVTIFTTTYLYICFVYADYAASALAFMTFSRYVISGALLPASIPMYENLGPHYTLTIVGCLSAVMAPVPFLLYRYGHKIRAMSKNVQNKS